MMWSNKEDINKKILVDSDVLRHFIKGKFTDRLGSIFPGQLHILDLVEAEICKSQRIKPCIIKMIEDGTLKRMNFPTGTRFLTEYSRLASKFGVGESACMAVARHRDDIIGSNNLNDIKTYCEDNDILYLTTIDFLYVAFEKGVMSEADVDYFLYNNLNCVNPSKIPCSTYQEIKATNPAIAAIFQKTA